MALSRCLPVVTLTALMVNEILNIKGARNIFFSCGQFFSVGTVYTVYSIQCTMFKTELDWMGNNFTRFTLVYNGQVYM